MLSLAFVDSSSDGHEQFESSGVVDFIAWRVTTCAQTMSNATTHESINLCYET